MRSNPGYPAPDHDRVSLLEPLALPNSIHAHRPPAYGEAKLLEPERTQALRAKP